MKAVLKLINTEGEVVSGQMVDQNDWHEFRFPSAERNWGSIRFCDVEFEDGLKSRVEFNILRNVCLGDILQVTFDDVRTEEDFRAIAIRLTGWKPLELPERMMVLKRLAEERRNNETGLYDLQWEALSEERVGGFCPVPIMSEM